MFIIKKAGSADLDAVTRLFLALWPSHEEGELREEFAGLLKEEESAVFLCVADGEPVAAAQCGLRHDYVEGTSSSPVGYLEGIYVSPAYRRQGIAGKLCAACENWAREKGCAEFASDCALENTGSFRFHMGLGFTEAGRIICFTKKL